METFDKEITQLEALISKYHVIFVDVMINSVIAIVIFIIGFVIAKVVSRTIIRFANKRNFDLTIAHFSAVIIRYMILLFTFITVLSQLGIQTTSIITALGAASLAVGLALQGSLSNFAAGVLLILFRPIRLDDYVDLGGVTGKVLSLQIFSCTLLSDDGKVITVSNSKVLAANIINYTLKPFRRFEIIVNVNYNADVTTTKELFIDILKAHPNILENQGITVRLTEIGNSSIAFVIRAWTINSTNSSTRFDILESLKQAIDENQLTISTSRFDVNLINPEK